LKISRLDEFTLGWFIGDFSPAIYRTALFEVCIKFFKAGDVEPSHYQMIATEITAIISGEALLGGKRVKQGDIIEIGPAEIVNFEALTDVSLVAIKFPSLPKDKVVV
jgi:hypothetical protein